MKQVKAPPAAGSESSKVVLAPAGMLNTTKIVMSAPLPRVYEDAGGGKANPVAAAPGPTGTIGGDFRVEELTRVSKETVREHLQNQLMLLSSSRGQNYMRACSSFMLTIAGMFAVQEA